MMPRIAVSVCCTALALMISTAQGGFYPEGLPDNAPGWFSRKDWLPPSRDLKALLADIKLCQKPEVAAEKWGSFSGLACLFVEMELWPSWLKHLEEPAQVAFQWPTHPILVQWPELPPIVVRDDVGGVIMKYIEHWQDLAAQGDDVDILGPCLSACTLVVGYIPKDRLCFGENASLQFHAARELDGQISLWATRWMISKYPDDIRRWLALRGPPENMTVHEWWILPASDLWKMGYKRCHA
jgi:hypothetical protein